MITAVPVGAASTDLFPAKACSFTATTNATKRASIKEGIRGSGEEEPVSTSCEAYDGLELSDANLNGNIDYDNDFPDVKFMGMKPSKRGLLLGTANRIERPLVIFRRRDEGQKQGTNKGTRKRIRPTWQHFLSRDSSDRIREDIKKSKIEPPGALNCLAKTPGFLPLKGGAPDTPGAFVEDGVLGFIPHETGASETLTRNAPSPGIVLNAQ